MKQRKSILIVLSVLVVILLGLGGWFLLSDRQPPELTTVATYQVECGKAVTVEELVARVADRSSFELTLSGDGEVSSDGKSITFRKTGTFPVTVEAVDAKGNRTQETVTVTAEDKTPPELTADIGNAGIVLTGGGAKLRGLDTLISKQTKMRVRIAEEPEDCVILGAGRAVQWIDSVKMDAGKEHGNVPLTAYY